MEGKQAVMKAALDAGVEELLECDGICLGTPDYFSYMAGGLKDFFDRTFYPARGKVTGKPCGIFVTHGGGGKPAAESVERVCRSFDFRQVADPVLVLRSPDEQASRELISLGETIARSCANRKE